MNYSRKEFTQYTKIKLEISFPPLSPVSVKADAIWLLYSVCKGIKKSTGINSFFTSKPPAVSLTAFLEQTQKRKYGYETWNQG